MKKKILYKYIEGAKSYPLYKGSKGSSGIDVCSQKSYKLERGESKLISTGLTVSIPEGYEIQVRPRSGLALKHGITVLNTPGTVDADYRGEIGIILINHSFKPFYILPGDRVAQLVVAKVETPEFDFEEVNSLDETDRGAGGFGSTGTTVKEEVPTEVEDIVEEEEEVGMALEEDIFVRDKNGNIVYNKDGSPRKKPGKKK